MSISLQTHSRVSKNSDFLKALYPRNPKRGIDLGAKRFHHVADQRNLAPSGQCASHRCQGRGLSSAQRFAPLE